MLTRERNFFEMAMNHTNKVWILASTMMLGASFATHGPALSGEFCVPENAQPWCGGASPTNPEKELSCTPFNYRPWTSQGGGGQDPGFCKEPIMLSVAGGYFNTTKAWMNFNSNGSPESGENKSYFVLHSCDGAGIMPDCKGDQRYVERIYSLSNDQSQVHCQDGITLSQVPTAPYNSRRQCNFKHPGTGNIYKNYEAGTWGWSENKIPYYMVASAKNHGWGNNDAVTNMVINQAVNPFGTTNEQTLVMVTYPWVCTGVSGDNDQTGLFTNPRTPKAKCYWDNEPGHYNGSPGWPPVVNVYWMKLDNDGKQDFLTVYGYYLQNSSNGPSMQKMANGNSWRLYACNRGECPW